MIVDAVGVTETELQETPPLDRKPTVPLDRLLRQVSFGVRDPDPISTIASRLSRLDRRLSETQRTQLTRARRRYDHQGDRPRHRQCARPRPPARGGTRRFGWDRPTVDEIAAASKALLDEAVAPLARTPSSASGSSRPAARTSRRSTRRPPTSHRGRLLRDATDRARDDHPELGALLRGAPRRDHRARVLYSRPYTRRLTFREVKELAQAIQRPPYSWTPDRLWQAYEALDRSKVRGSGARVLTDLVSLVRFALHQERRARPVPGARPPALPRVAPLRGDWGACLTPEQLAWLERIRDHVAASLGISAEDFDYAPFRAVRRARKAAQVFGDDLGPLLEELNEVLVT